MGRAQDGGSSRKRGSSTLFLKMLYLCYRILELGASPLVLPEVQALASTRAGSFKSPRDMGRVVAVMRACRGECVGQARSWGAPPREERALPQGWMAKSSISVEDRASGDWN